MGSPPASTPPPSPPPPPPSPTPPRSPPTSDASASTSAMKRTHKASHLRSKADGPHRKKLRTYLGIVACDTVDITYENWKEVSTAQKDLIWEDIQAEFDIPEASDSRTKRKLLQTRQFKSDLTRKWALAADQDGVEDTVCDKYGISKEKWAQFCQTRRDPSWEDVRIKAQAIQKQNTAPHAEKTKKKLQEAAQSGSVDGVINPPSPVRRHVKIRLRSRPHRDRSSPMDVRIFWPLLLDVQSTLDVFVLLEPVSPSSNTLDRLHGRPTALPSYLLTNYNS
ncbi:hypothetical protein GmHk_10G029046 [Glycine max]|nr:hypothetical protein GmHk_10G029046 [Glycine max]